MPTVQQDGDVTSQIAGFRVEEKIGELSAKFVAHQHQQILDGALLEFKLAKGIATHALLYSEISFDFDLHVTSPGHRPHGTAEAVVRLMKQNA